MKRVVNHGRVRFKVDARDALTGARKRLFYETAAAAKAKAKEQELAAEAAEPLHPLCDPDVTLARYGQSWLDAHAGGWKPRTLRSYSDTFRLHLAPLPLGGGLQLGDVKVRDLHRGHVKALVVTKKRDGHAPASVRLMLVAFSLIADAAIGDRLLRTHPADRALKKELWGALKTVESKPKPFLVPQMQLFLKVAREDSLLHSLYVVGFAAGLRLGELTGLYLSDLSGGPKPKLHVERQLGQDASMLNPVPTSTKNGKDRYVDASGVLVRTFEALRVERTKLALANGWRPIPSWAFITGNGTPVSQRFVETDFKRILKRAKLPDHLTPHGMRHSFGCVHIARGCQPKWLQQQMGHSSISITLDRYGDWWNLEDHAAAERLGALVDDAELAADGSGMAAEGLFGTVSNTSQPNPQPLHGLASRRPARASKSQ